MMAKKKQQEQAQNTEVLQPDTVEHIPQAAPGIEVPAGHILIVHVDENGNEYSPFTIDARGWKYYADNPKFKKKEKTK